MSIIKINPVASPAPQVVTRAQARAALILAGLIDQVQPLIDAIPDSIQRALAQNDWDNRQTFERNHPTMLQLASGLGLTSEQLDGLFTQAAAL